MWYVRWVSVGSLGNLGRVLGDLARENCSAGGNRCGQGTGGKGGCVLSVVAFGLQEEFSACKSIKGDRFRLPLPS